MMTHTEKQEAVKKILILTGGLKAVRDLRERLEIQESELNEKIEGLKEILKGNEGKD